MNFNTGLCLGLLALPIISVAQDRAPIVDMSTSASADEFVDESFKPKPYKPSAASKMAESRYDLMQGLRDEVRLLRGMVEELKHELQQVKQRQLDDYLDIDRRLGSQALADDNVYSDDQSGSSRLAQLSRLYMANRHYKRDQVSRVPMRLSPCRRMGLSC